MKIESDITKRYFVLSDIHGHYNEMMTSLSNAGYCENNGDILVILGDMFDRGTQSKEVLQYIYKLFKEDKCRIVIGNHDIFLLELIDNNFSRVQFNIEHNGFLETLKSLSSNANEIPLNLSLVREEIIEEYPFLYDWIDSLPNYIEIGKYIMVHGGIDGFKRNWKESSRRDFVWSKEYLLPSIDNRIVVAGHHRTATINNTNCDYNVLFKEKPEEFGVLYLEGKILIDGFVEISKRINVLIIEE